jgi:glycosyltransferase involved in cell wall biosynthesis
MNSDVAVLQTDLIRSNGAELVSMMQARELDADLWALRYDEDVFPGIAEEIDIYEYGVSLPLDFPLSTTFNTLAPAFADPAFLKGYDAVIAHKDLSEILAYRAKKKYGTKFIWYMHNTSDLLYRNENMPLPIRALSRTLGRYLRRKDSQAFDAADKVFVNSRLTMEERVIPDLGENEDMEVLHPPVRGLEETEGSRDYVAVLSRVSPGKNIERAIKEMEGRNEVLKISGKIKDRGYREQLENLAEEKGVDIEFMGFVPDDQLDEFISNAKFGIYPSEFETFGLVPLEMMSAGTPCFVNEDTGVSEVLSNDFKLPIDSGIPTPKSIHELNESHYEKLKGSVVE